MQRSLGAYLKISDPHKPISQYVNTEYYSRQEYVVKTSQPSTKYAEALSMHSLRISEPFISFSERSTWSTFFRQFCTAKAKKALDGEVEERKGEDRVLNPLYCQGSSWESLTEGALCYFSEMDTTTRVGRNLSLTGSSLPYWLAESVRDLNEQDRVIGLKSSRIRTRTWNAALKCRNSKRNW
jgi:hypothetical protein